MVAGTVSLRPQEKGAHTFRRGHPLPEPSLGGPPCPSGGTCEGVHLDWWSCEWLVAGGGHQAPALCGTQVWRPLWVPWWPYEQGGVACGAVEPAGLEADAGLHSAELPLLPQPADVGFLKTPGRTPPSASVSASGGQG